MRPRHIAAWRSSLFFVAGQRGAYIARCTQPRPANHANTKLGKKWECQPTASRAPRGLPRAQSSTPQTFGLIWSTHQLASLWWSTKNKEKVCVCVGHANTHAANLEIKTKRSRHGNSASATVLLLLWDPGLLLQGMPVVRERERREREEVRHSSTRLCFEGCCAAHICSPFGTSQMSHTERLTAPAHPGGHPCMPSKAQTRKGGACAAAITMQRPCLQVQ